METKSKYSQFLAIIFSALALSVTSAHVLEYPQKINLDIPTYTIINSQLYKFFAIIGGVYCMLALLFSGLVAWLTRTHSYGQWTLVGCLFHIGWFLSWLFIVQPVNRSIAMQGDPDLLYSLWSEYRSQWEYGHITGFVLHLGALSCLVTGIIKQNDQWKRNNKI